MKSAIRHGECSHGLSTAGRVAAGASPAITAIAAPSVVKTFTTGNCTDDFSHPMIIKESETPKRSDDAVDWVSPRR